VSALTYCTTMTTCPSGLSVMDTCSPNRPNPVGLHRARIVARDGLRIEVDALEAIDGTPVVDVKPAIGLPA
jgi:tRNA (Thr-GGU) A37 N-methylase